MTTDVKVRIKGKKKESSTNLSLMVESITEEEILKFDENKIKLSLMEELDLNDVVATEIMREVVKKLGKLFEDSTIKTLDTSVIRSFVNVVLYEKGYQKELKSKKDIVISTHDITQLIEEANQENGNLEHSPEEINFTLAERILKEYTLKTVYSKEVEKAHMNNEIYVHDLGSASIRAYCGGHSIEYLKLYGMRNIPTILSTSKPANSAWTLARHLCSFTQVLSGLFAGAIGYEFLNGFFAPLLIGWNKSKLKQLAQTLIFDLSQLGGAKGGQTSFTDFNCYITIPDYYKETFAIGKSGQYMGITKLGKIIYYKDRNDLLYDESLNKIKILKYKHFEKESQNFLYAILEVIGEGDATGLPFAFPKINLHINENTFTKRILTKKEKQNYDKILDNEKEGKIYKRIENKESIALLKFASQQSSKKGCPYFIFDRDGASISSCCRLKSTINDVSMLKEPERLTFVGVQNVSINLPNISLKVGKDEEKFYKELERRIDLCIKAHLQKKKQLEKIMSLKNSPLKFYNTGMSNTKYIDLDKGSYLIGIVGLNECVYNLINQELHQSDEAYLKGLEIISYMNLKIKELSKKIGLNLKLEETPAESTAAKFAISDYKKYDGRAFMKENELGKYYSNSIHFAYDCNISYMDRLIKQSKFHPLIDAGAIIHLWTGEKNISAESIFELVKKTWYETQCSQWVLSPEFTSCKDCNNTFIGEYKVCPKCKNENIMNYTRITGYYTPINHWNSGKKAERKDRKYETYNIE